MTWGHAASVLTHRVGSPCQHPTLCLGEGVHALASVSPQPLLQASPALCLPIHTCRNFRLGRCVKYRNFSLRGREELIALGKENVVAGFGGNNGKMLLLAELYLQTPA